MHDLVHAELVAAFGGERVRRNARLAPLTTFRVGGPADWLIELRDATELLKALAIAAAAGLPVTMLGGGSNVLISDAGIRGLVVRLRNGAIERVASNLIRAEAGVTINGLVRWTINRGLAGLEAWAGTPGTVGGGVFGNAHFGSRLLGELIEKVRIATPAAEVRELSRAEMEFGYDDSRLQRTREILLSADFRISSDDPAKLRTIARESLAYRKRTQPLDTPSAGCVFRNPDPTGDPLSPNTPASAGALIDRARLKGYAVGCARISPTHANFIVNESAATAEDIRALVRLCKVTVAERFGVELREEIVYLGEFKRADD